MKSLEHFKINVAILRNEIADLSLEEIGCYIRMILHQWETGGVPSSPERLKAICGWDVSEFVLRKFETGSDGMLRAFWLEQQRKREETFRQKQLRNGKKRWLGNANPVPSLENVVLCGCGCGKPVKPGRKFVDRTHANRCHGQTIFAGKPKINVIQETAGHGSAVEATSFHGGR